LPDTAAMTKEYVAFALVGDRRGAIGAVLGPLDRGEIDVPSLYDDVLAPAARRIGDLWHLGDISVADEHFATRLTQDVMAEARWIAPPGAAEPRERVVLACAPEEQHEIGLRMLADVLAAHGWDVHLLGARTPARALVAYATKVDASAVGLSCGSPLSVPSLAEAVGGLRDACPGVRILLGGRVVEDYPTIVGALGADAGCTRLAEAPDAVELLVTA